MIFTKGPLNDDALIMLPGVKSWNMLQFIRSSLISVIYTGSILHYHHRSLCSLPPFYRTSLNFQLSKIDTVMDVSSPCYV